MSIQYRQLGASGLRVSEISLGSWLTYGGYVERENAVNSIRKAYELGINFFDTANVYAKEKLRKSLEKRLKTMPGNHMYWLQKYLVRWVMDPTTVAYPVNM